MRYMTVNLYMDWQSFHPVEHRLAREPELRRKALHSIKLLDDDTIALLAEVEGDLDRYREIMRESPEVERFTVSGDDSGFCYSQTRVTEPSREMFRRREQGDFIIEMPIEYTDGVFGALTDRQQEVLATAVRLGYYENPREATLADLAAELDVDPATVGKHLRTVESKVFAEYVP